MGVSWDGLHEDVKEYLLRRAETEEERQEVKDRLALHPGTGRVVAVGMWLPHEDRGSVLVEGSGGWQEVGGEEGFLPGTRLFAGSEQEILEEFWQVLGRNVGRVVTYNGRKFDGPFLMTRSVMLGVEPTRNLVPYRYSFKDHCDLAEVLSFFGARSMNSLQFWCRQFGIDSPKETMSGDQVGAFYLKGDLESIARYSLEDARATASLYLKVLPLIRVTEQKR